MVVILLLGAHLSLLYSHRALLFEQRASANQWRATLAQEAAEAGIEWALARLNDPQAANSACLPVSAAPGDAVPGGSTLRYRWVASLATAAPMQPACVHNGTTWQCQCPDGGAGSVSLQDTAVDRPAFGVALARDNHAGLFTVTATGCSGIGPGCGRSGGASPDARHHITVTVAPLGQMSSPPLAPITSLGPVTLSQGTTVINSDPATGGTTVNSGGAIDIQAPARALGPPGQPVAAGLVGNDAALRAGADALWRRLFGMDRSTLSALPSWEHLSCAGGCTDADILAALGRGTRALWVDGDLSTGNAAGTTSTTSAWGSADAPVLLVVGGTARLGAGLQLQGLLVADAVQSSGAGSARSELRGALVSLGATTLGGPATLDIVYDSAVLGRLSALGGMLAKVPGSWFDPHD